MFTRMANVTWGRSHTHAGQKSCQLVKGFLQTFYWTLVPSLHGRWAPSLPYTCKEGLVSWARRFSHVDGRGLECGWWTSSPQEFAWCNDLRQVGLWHPHWPEQGRAGTHFSSVSFPRALPHFQPCPSTREKRLARETKEGISCCEPGLCESSIMSKSCVESMTFIWKWVCLARLVKWSCPSNTSNSNHIKAKHHQPWTGDQWPRGRIVGHPWYAGSRRGNSCLTTFLLSYSFTLLQTPATSWFQSTLKWLPTERQVQGQGEPQS